MLILSRVEGQSIELGPEIKITVTDLRSDRVKIGIEAPEWMPVYRTEIADSIRNEGGTMAKSRTGLKETGISPRVAHDLRLRLRAYQFGEETPLQLIEALTAALS